MKRRKQFNPERRELLASVARFILIAIVIVGGYFGTKHINERSAREIAKVKNREESEDYLLSHDVRMNVVDDKGEQSMVITGESVRLSTDQQTAVFTGAHAIFLEDGRESLVMDAAELEYNTQTEDFILTGLEMLDKRDGMRVEAPVVEWRRVKDPTRSRGTKIPSFRFAQGVQIWQEQTDEDGAVVRRNYLEAKYMQADKELYYLELVGSVKGEVSELKDTTFITERNLTQVEELKLEDFEKLNFEAEQVIYDKRSQVVLCTSRLYDRTFLIKDMDGRAVKIEDYQTETRPVEFRKEAITIQAHHLEAHIEKQWVECLGDVAMLIPPDEPEAGDDRALKVVKRYETRVASEDIEYFWGRDYILTHGPTRVEQKDRLALADQITYWGDQKQVLLEGHINIVMGDGSWLVDEELVSVDDHDMRRAVTSYSELYGDKAVVYLNNNDFIASGGVFLRQDDREVAADLIVYQDDIKRITADGNVKFRDKDDQQLICNALVFHNESDFLEVSGGASATISIPAKYANDINVTLADMRETDRPPEIVDPPVDDDAPVRNPNQASDIARGLTARPAGVSIPEGTALSIPGRAPAGSDVGPEGPREIVIELGEEEEEVEVEEEEEPSADPPDPEEGEE